MINHKPETSLPPSMSTRKKLSAFLKDNDEFIGFLVGIITSVTFILNKVNAIKIKEEHLLIIVDLLNICILLLAMRSITDTELRITGGEAESLKKQIILTDQRNFESLRIRTNGLVRQLVFCIRWFCIILALFYLLQLYTDAWGTPYDKIKLSLEQDTDITELLASGNAEASRYLFLEILINAANIFSAAYLIMAFQVLFISTIGADDRTWEWKSYIPIAIALVITVVNILVFLCKTGIYLSNMSHMIRLLGGIFNGVAMSLLFSRFISMEYFFQNSKDGYQKSFYFYGTIIALPLYVVAQPLYGLFNAVETGRDSPELFKTAVFLICFWGKLVLLLFIYTMLRKKWIHCYLFLVLSQRDTLLQISKELDDVPDIDSGKKF